MCKYVKICLYCLNKEVVQLNINIKKQYPMILSIVLSFIFLTYLLLFDVSKKAESYISLENVTLSDNVEVLPLPSGRFLILSSSENKSLISCFDATLKTIVCSLELDYGYSSAKVSDDCLYIVKSVRTDDGITFKKYLISDNSISETPGYPYPIETENKYSLAVTKNNSMFFINGNQPNEIAVIDSSGDFIRNLEHEGKSFKSIATNPSGTKLYAITTDGTFISFDANYPFTACPISDNIGEDACTFLSDNLFVSATNKVYSIGQDSMGKTVINNISSIYWSSCLFGNYLLGQVSENSIDCYDMQTKTVTHQITLEQPVLALATSDNVTIAILKNNNTTKKGIKVITTSDLIAIVTDPSENEEPPPDPSYGISSTKYTINFEAKTISNVPLNTTIAVFKTNIQSTKDYTISFVNYLGSSFSSGNLGTGSKVYFDIGLSEPLIFKIIINGDITGEGNKNSRDKDFLYNHLFGKSSLIDEYLAAADVNGDGKVNTIDLLIMDKSFRSS